MCIFEAILQGVPMLIVTLLSDWGLSDYYVAAVRGKFYQEMPTVQLIDISHDIPKYNLIAAAYVLKNAFPYFPQGSIHCIGVNDIASSQSPHILVYEQGHYFLGADNGIFSMIFAKKPEKAWKIELSHDGNTSTFPSLDLFPLVAAHIGRGGSAAEIGEAYHWQGKDFSLRTDIPIPEIYKNAEGEEESGFIHGRIIYVDSYGNGVTNINKTLFEQFTSRFKRFDIRMQSYSSRNGKGSFGAINEVYHENLDGDLCALFLNNQHLEISLNRSSAANLLGIRIGVDVKIYFTH